MDALLRLDRTIFELINQTWSHSCLDVILPWMREATSWIPMYLIIAVFVVYRYKKKGLLWTICVLLSVGVSDVISSQIIKPIVARPRPCHLIEEWSEMMLRISCGTGYSFTSSHATNHMCLAVFIICAVRPWKWTSWIYILILWAFLISYAQVYVGVHYPLDVISGMFLGAMIGWLMNKLYHRLNQHFFGQPIT